MQFDDIGCATLWLEDKPWKDDSRTEIWVIDHQTGDWKESEEQGYYLVQPYWESEEAFWGWTRSESFRIAHSNRPPAEMFAGKNVLEIHEVAMTTEKAEG